MSRCRATVEIGAPPDVVFRYLYRPEHLTRWVTGLVDVSDPDGEPRVGTHQTMVIEARRRRHEVESETTQVVSGRILAGLAKTKGFDTVGVQELEDLGGRTRLTITCRYVYHSFLLKLLGPPMERYGSRRMARDLGRLKEIVEADLETTGAL